MFKIVTKKVLSEVNKLMEIEAPLVARKAQPGQFIMLRVSETGERIPLTIADSDKKRGTVTIIFQEIGKTTRELGTKEAGGYLNDFVGPLGKPMEMPSSGRVIAVGGGVGIAPLYPKVKAFQKAGLEVISIIGAKTASLLMLIDEMCLASKELHVCTDDGTKGYKGFVTDLLQSFLDDKTKKIDEIIAIGPIPMMTFVANQTRPYGIKTMVSLNPIMVDGTGMCGCCRVTVGGEIKFSCIDGPVFDGHRVDFKELARRSRTYLDKEKIALDKFEHECKCGGEELWHLAMSK
ncbi:MAG TPA: sulfide/dihydroorotate dehydrogenase-like FAD/NAD-binding protein [Firmicutes bacterium]|jgi:ferredoxin--NADP+ reductase|nr:sulfide/dihydroorotate dehydrogenase-like FAD/NAD-binding protein [Bacillota bacterium]